MESEQLREIARRIEEVVALPGPTLQLGSAGTSIFIEITAAPGPDGKAPPLMSLPVADGETINLMIHTLRLGYGWQPPSVEFRLVADLDVPPLAFDGGVGILLPEATPTHPSVSTSLQLKVATPPLPPVPIVEWDLSFGAVDLDPDLRGLELVLGESETERWLTLYLRRTLFNPTFFLLRLGGIADFGLFLGPPPNTRDDKSFYLDL